MAPPSNGESLKPDEYRWEEYRLVQEKIDKLGDFKFHLKNWMIGLVTGILIGGHITNQSVRAHITSFVVIIAFFLLETLQANYESALGLRARIIESNLRRQGSPVFERRRKVKFTEIKDLDRFPPDSITHALYLRGLSLRRSFLGKFVL